MSRKFQRKIEDFVCENCGAKIKGDGYTNHCPVCLWSKHVDNNPGDRENECNGLMEPVDAFFRNSCWHIVHRCQKCAKEKSVRLSDQDNKTELEKIIRKRVLS